MQFASTNPSFHPPGKLLRVALILVLLLGFYDSIALAIWYWPGRTFNGPTSGVWTAHAVDFANGIFYRPLVSELGYGGTRYMPLSFVLHGLLIKFFVNPTVTGVFYMQASVVFMIAAMVRIMTQRGVPFVWAVAVAAVTFATSLYEAYLTDVNSDYLAAGFSLWGMAFFLQSQKSDHTYRAIYAVSIACFVAAFYTKFSSIYGPAAVFFYLASTRNWRSTASFSFWMIATTLTVGAAVYGVSDGRIVASISHNATGGTDLRFALGFARRFFFELFYHNPAIGICFLVALLHWGLELTHRWRDPINMLFVTVTLVSLVTYSSRGIAGNHVIALNAVCLILAGSALLGGRKSRAGLVAGLFALSLIIVVTWLPGMPSPRKTLESQNNPRIDEIMSVRDRRIPEGALIFSTHPMYVLAAGRDAYLLDTFSLKLLLKNGHPAGDDFRSNIRSGAFAVLIVGSPSMFDTAETGDPQSPIDPSGNPFLERHYQVAERLGNYYVMVPRLPK